MNRTAVLYALASAVLFGISTPAAKLLLGSVHPALLAGVFYCGAGCGVAIVRGVGATRRAARSRRRNLDRLDRIRKLDEGRFRKGVLILLLASGVALAV